MSSNGRSRAEQAAEHYGSFVFAAVVVAMFAQLAFARHLRGEPWEVIVTFVGGAIYGCAGVLCSRWTDVGSRAAYFIGQTVLITTVLLLSPGRGFFGIIVLPLASQAVFDLRWPWVALLNAWLYAACVAAVGVAFGAPGAQQAMIGYAPAFIFTVVFSMLARRAFTAQREAERLSAELAEANQQLRAQSVQAEELATTRERNRLAREIHDGLGHYLTVINVQLEAARALFAREPARAADALAKATQLSRAALDEVRRSVADLHLNAAIAPLSERIHALCAEAGASIRCELAGTPRPLSAAIDHALYRAAQEGLTNVRKHAGQASAALELDFRDPRRVRLHVSDNGQGNGACDTPVAGMGLRGMRERVELLDGRVSTRRIPGGGFELTVELPT